MIFTVYQTYGGSILCSKLSVFLFSSANCDVLSSTKLSRLFAYFSNIFTMLSIMFVCLQTGTIATSLKSAIRLYCNRPGSNAKLCECNRKLGSLIHHKIDCGIDGPITIDITTTTTTTKTTFFNIQMLKVWMVIF